MKKALLLTLLATVQARATLVCQECKIVTDAMDNYDPTTIASYICPETGEFEEICETILPPVIALVQSSGEIDAACDVMCNNGEDYDYFGDYNGTMRHPFDLPHEETEDLNVARDHGQHPFDLPHEESEDLNVARDHGQHPFDLPHEESEDLNVARDHGQHPFDLPHEESEDLNVARDQGQHPFDLPHEESEDLNVARDHGQHPSFTREHGHHPFDLPHEEIISSGEAVTDTH